jgi:hypothetical protein
LRGAFVENSGAEM